MVLIKVENGGYFVDKETGEMIPVPPKSEIRTQEERDQMREIVEYKNELALRNNELNKVRGNLCGEFFWTTYEDGKSYYPDIPDDMLAKIIYLLTYLDYDKNILVVRDSVTEPYRPMLRDDVRKVIRLHRCKFSNFWKKLMSTGIISENEDGSLSVSPHFFRGKLSKGDKQGTAAMKIFTHAVRYLYENTEVRSHRYLAYLYRLIPYISLKYNILCFNPLETQDTNIRKMTAKDLCELLGMDESNQKRLIDTLLNLSFVDKCGDERSVIRVIVDKKNSERRNFILINPQFYSGYIQETDLLSALKEFTTGKEDLLV